MSTVKKGDRVTYRPAYDRRRRIRATVVRTHRDQTATVQAMFFLDEAGKDDGFILGYKYRMHTNMLESI